MLKHRGFPGRMPGTDFQFTIRRANVKEGATKLIKRERFRLGRRTRFGRRLGRLLPRINRIVHHEYRSSSNFCSASRARWTRIFRAPTVASSNTAISS